MLRVIVEKVSVGVSGLLPNLFVYSHSITYSIYRNVIVVGLNWISCLVVNMVHNLSVPIFQLQLEFGAKQI